MTHELSTVPAVVLPSEKPEMFGAHLASLVSLIRDPFPWLIRVSERGCLSAYDRLIIQCGRWVHASLVLLSHCAVSLPLLTEFLLHGYHLIAMVQEIGVLRAIVRRGLTELFVVGIIKPDGVDSA